MTLEQKGASANKGTKLELFLQRHTLRAMRQLQIALGLHLGKTAGSARELAGHHAYTINLINQRYRCRKL